jgi:hypothetical protein
VTIQAGDRVRYTGSVSYLNDKIGVLVRSTNESTHWVYVRFDERGDLTAVKLVDLQQIDPATVISSH